ncbi:Ribonuclease III [Lasiodiplodia theobromae]|uniref:Ribonuclease III n=1 Tax=Lasiodiplodia theobromae TaxID=45133 RepID=UPI0015C3D16F|nr:Ribonuclease III [Lasiodiplodia theobromae]KAF4536034.1 Ribonuclease III [Lasiodiplodia theobromae]
MESPNGEPTFFCLRSYQAEMVEESLKQNIIVAMDTGSGKTHVAISRTAAELESCNPDQLVWFIAPTVTLCHQQFCLFEKHLPAYEIRFLSGNDNVDRWTDQNIWDAVLRNVRIVVSTPAVLLDALTHAFVKLPRLALLIFDEAHMCRGNHPASAIMQRFYHPLLANGDRDSLPKILGLTASPVVSANASGLEIIERSLNAIAKTPKIHRTDLLRFTHRPELVQLNYPGQYLDPSAGPPVLAALANVYHAYDILEDPYILSLRKKASETTDETRDQVLRELEKLLHNRKTYIHEQLKKLYSRALGIYNELGGPPTEFYIRSCIAKFDAFLTNSSHLLLDWSSAEGKHLHDMLATVAAAPPVSQHTGIHDSLSPKMNTLVDLLLSEWNADFTGIIFVEQRATVAAMDHVLSNHPRLRDLFSVGTFVGTSMTVHRKSHLGIGDLVEIKHQQQTLEEFRAGKKNLIVATAVLEEGIDVSNCHIVICFEPPKNLKSFIQRRGRARKKDSKFVIMFPDDSTFVKSPEMWLDLEEQMKEAYLNDQRVVQAAEQREELEEDGDDTYRCESTGALLTLDNAMQHLYHFCAILGDGQHVDLRPRFFFTVDQNDRTTATVTLPSSVSKMVRQHRGTGSWLTERAARKDAAFQAYVALHKAGLVNDNLLPLPSDPEDQPDFGVVDKRPAMIEVHPRLDPWIPLAQLISLSTPLDPWYRTKMTISMEPQPVTLVILLPQPMLHVPDFLLHWNETIRYTLSSEPMDAITLSKDEVTSLQHSTRTLLYEIFQTRMVEERYDFPFLIAQPGAYGEGERQFLEFGGESRPALEVYAELQAGLSPTIGLLHPKGVVGAPLMFRRFQIPDISMTEDENLQQEEEATVQVVCSAFPKRRDFLHYIRDSAQYGMYTKETILPAEGFLMSRLPVAYSMFAAFLPSILHRYELFMIVQELCDTAVRSVGFTNHELVLRAITASSTNENDYQRLEFLGDCILKYSTAVQLMADFLHWPESYLTERKDRIVSNGALAKASRRTGLDKFIITKAFTGSKWRPRYVQDILATSQAALQESQTLSTKTLADVVESLIGAAFVEGGIHKAHLCTSTFLTSLEWKSLHHCRTILQDHAAEEHASAPVLHLERVEELIGYTFKNKYLLLEALTHASFTAPREAASSSYQRLEYLGDAVLDYIISGRLYAHRRKPAANANASNDGGSTIPPRGHAADELPHWTMHSIRAALVNASFLAFLCMEATIFEPRTDVVFAPSSTTTAAPLPLSTALANEQPYTVPGTPSRKALWHFLRHSSPTLLASATAATARHERYSEDIWRALRQHRRYPWRLFAKVGAEKFFSDIVEAVLGAVFIDSTTNSSLSVGDNEMVDGAEGQEKNGKVVLEEEEELEACERFLEKIGLMDVLDRFMRDEVDCLHPKTQLGRLAGSDKVVWEWDEGDLDAGEAESPEGGMKGKRFRCRVGLGETWVGDWVDGETRHGAETEAADRAVLTLVAQGRSWRGMERWEGASGDEIEGGNGDGDEVKSEESEEVDQVVAGAVIGDDSDMDDATPQPSHAI